ncbi:hypothetical protein XELAEV_18028469mg [Xenopus laevis]|uniref:Uncharacterized protein n=1 Tax=Xenopus laevis TaxID=8355 RepID=A0A974HL46_XENLA|nr:hypothetical protein XELAEV_18028469mg [Xenopus laevis]
MGGNWVKIEIKNETPYPISYVCSYQASWKTVQKHGILCAGQMVQVDQYAQESNIFVKQGDRTSDECLYHYDLFWRYNGLHFRTITIREKSSDKSELELIGDSRNEILTCPNYDTSFFIKGKQEKDEEETENKRLKENLSKILDDRGLPEPKMSFPEKFNGVRSNFFTFQETCKLYLSFLSHSFPTGEVVEKKFYQILKDNFLQDKERSTRTIAEIIQNMRLQIMLKYIEEKQLSVDCLKNWDDLVGFKNLSLRDELSVLEAMIGVALNPNNSQILVKNKNKDDRVNYSVSILSKLFTINKELASNGLTHIEKSTGKGLLSGIDCCE